jgi:L-glyceraldehyde 3-phosphate reductase
MAYLAEPTRYDSMSYNRCGRSGIKLPAVSLGLWHNFGGVDPLENSRAMARLAFDLGITHFDLANNYGPPYGSAEETFGQIMRKDLKPYRDELIISSKAGWDMWPGPYGDFGSRKYLIASLDQSLKRMGLEYVDIFYHHRPDPDTPLEETMGALEQIVRSGRALYVGISSYSAEETLMAEKILSEMDIHLMIHQPSYNMFDRWIEAGLLDVLAQKSIGCIVFSPLAQGLLTNRYLKDIPDDSRAAKPGTYLNQDDISAQMVEKVRCLHQIAQQRNQSMAQMAISWVLRNPTVTSALFGASRPQQIREIVGALDHLNWTEAELQAVEACLK